MTRWCILRTAGPRTLPLARSLTAAGFEAWTPVRARLTDKVGAERAEQAIVPTFVFVGAQYTDDLLALSHAPVSRHPPFSLFRRSNRIPFIGVAALSGLRAAEDEAEAAYAASVEGRNREDQRRERIAQLQSERARRKALRAQPLGSLGLGTWVEVDEMPALAGLKGQIVEERGNAAVVAFGGLLRLEIEAWRMLPVAVERPPTCTA